MQRFCFAGITKIATNPEFNLNKIKQMKTDNNIQLNFNDSFG